MWSGFRANSVSLPPVDQAKVLHDPMYPKPWEVWCYSMLWPCRFFSIQRTTPKRGPSFRRNPKALSQVGSIVLGFFIKISSVCDSASLRRNSIPTLTRRPERPLFFQNGRVRLTSSRFRGGQPCQQLRLPMLATLTFASTSSGKMPKSVQRLGCR